MDSGLWYYFSCIPCSTCQVGPPSPEGGETVEKYETMLILDAQSEEGLQEELIVKFKDIIEREGGQVNNLDKWGKRRLAYEVKKHKEGFYVLINFQAPPEACHELERTFKINDEVLRYLIVREEE